MPEQPGPLPAGQPSDALVRETVYGSRKRLEWIQRFVRPGDEVLEVGCGTGYMICRPLAQLGHRIRGIDLDASSIAAGKELLAAEGLDPEILSTQPLSGWPSRLDVVIVSEVLEHLKECELRSFLVDVRTHLKPGGTFLVTVPNGYGWFEAEQFLWFKLGMGYLLFHGRVCRLIEKAKSRYLGPEAVDPGPPSTLADSPHVQRFTLRGLQQLLEEAGFRVEDARGSVACSGPFTNLLFAGVPAFLERNARWGDRLGALASGYFVACRAR